ncbi:MAG: hypothetical protein AAGN82_08115 [Myxococcota bacterium]
MTRRTRPTDADDGLAAVDLDEIVEDKRASWRAGAARGRRRNRRYQRMITDHLRDLANGAPTGGSGAEEA